ncbi:MAG: NADH:ubiquinone reductase (Na(+)-transporting) subunit E [Firmicutes bacterium HGW-Firmicutes-2]|jgi:Na+-transporting NADH:ubiquinone oxidoreductase subunit E|nr:MAG: NADH:ubiquinone reductase (Na(+)-transporting) subunit E [Firmicutes bacterium HGW-Firmicutes-2]
MEGLINIFMASVLTHNIALTYILGMCPLIAISKNLKTAKGMGASVILVITLTATINWPIYQLLKNNNAESISLLVFIITIAATVQFLEIFLDKYLPALYNAFGIFLPLITVNCAVLAVSLFMVNRTFGFFETVFFGFGSGTGWALAITIIAAIREKMALVSKVPDGLQGAGIVMIIAGIISLGFMGFIGVVGF